MGLDRVIHLDIPYLLNDIDNVITSIKDLKTTLNGFYKFYPYLFRDRKSNLTQMKIELDKIDNLMLDFNIVLDIKTRRCPTPALATLRAKTKICENHKEQESTDV